MQKVLLRSPAKINVTLDILGKDERVGKHFVNTILYRDDTLFDEIELQPIEEESNRLHCDHPDVPLGEENTLLQALRALKVSGWEVRLKKCIPVQSGLGGGSSNAAAILRYFGAKMHRSLHELEEIGRQIGADVPFFLQEENLVYCEGFGDQIVQGWNIKPLPITYLETGIQVSTAEGYARLDLDLCGEQSAQTELLLKKLQKDPELPSEIWEHFIHNDFELRFFEQYPEWKGKGNLCGSGGRMWKFEERSMVGREGFEPPKA
ncbi:MAG: 4-(cytidine 5'-diphospho)-2-C-methyl-D-erythritol kinase [Candidatus Altimarinota bacterium]